MPGPTPYEGLTDRMEIYGVAALAVASVGALAWVLITVLRKIPAVCKEAEKAVRALRSLRDEIRRKDPHLLTDSRSTPE